MSSVTAATKIKREPGIDMLVTPTNGRAVNGTSATKLASLAPARDLTLGGRGGPSLVKKVFTPNLNVVRNKNTNVKTSKDTTTRGRGRGGARGAGRGRGGRGAANSTLIQTTGLFSEGAGALHVRKSTSGYSSSNRNTDETTPSMMRKPLLMKHEHMLIDLKAEAAFVREQLGDSDDDLMDEKTDTELIPVKLKEAKLLNMNTVIKLEKTEDEPILNGDLNASTDALGIAAKLQALLVKHQDKNADTRPLPHLAHSLEEMFASNQTHLFVMQMPNTLPCDGDVESDDLEISISNFTKDGKAMPAAFSHAASTSANAKSTNANTPAATANAGTESDEPAKSRLPVFKNHLVLANATNYDLKTMEEGQVGKILRYKSGKVKLMLGDALFDLDMGTDPGFVQDIISISTNSEERNGNMINLGPLQAKITVSPDCKYYREDARVRYGA